MEPSHTLAVVVAAGRSARMGAELRKPFLPLAGTPVLVWTLRALAAAPSVARIVVVVHPDDERRAEQLLGASAPPVRVDAILAGGDERIDSVRAGAAWSGAQVDPILVHDGARPLVTPELVEAVIRAARAHGAALAALPLADTLKRSDDGRTVATTLAREGLWRAQTPQAFAAERFRECLARAERDGFRPSDDAALWERYVGPVALVPGSAANLKLTSADDLAFAEALARARGERP